MNQLTLKSKKIVIIGGVITLMLVLTLILLLVMTGKGGGQDGRSPIIIFSVMGLALISLLLFIYNRLRRTKYTSRLEMEYYEIYENLTDALRNSSLSIIERKEIQLDILGLLVQAQKESRPGSDIVGSDLPAFVKNIQASFGYRGRIGFHLLNGIQYFLFMLFVEQVAIYGIRGTDAFTVPLLGVQLILFNILISFILIPMMMFAVSRQKVLRMIVLPIGIVLLYIAATEVMYRFFEDAPWAQFYLDGEVGFITSWGTLVLWMALCAAAGLGKWILRRYAVRKIQAK